MRNRNKVREECQGLHKNWHIHRIKDVHNLYNCVMYMGNLLG